MTGTALVFSLSGFDAIDRRVDALINIDDRALLTSIGSLGEAQTRRRIAVEKTAPDGTPWPNWSPKYARRRQGSHSLLQSEGDLLDSIQYEVTGSEVEWGSNQPYAATHQFGDTDRNIPARTYLGLSPEDEREINDLLIDTFEGALQ